MHERIRRQSQRCGRYGSEHEWVERFDREVFLVDARGPSLVDERRRGKMLAIGTIEQKIESIAAGLCEQLAILALKVGVEQDGSFVLKNTPTLLGSVSFSRGS